MIAYEFEKRFTLPIDSRSKLMTLRSPSQRHIPLPGEEILLASGPDVLARVKVASVVRCVLILEGDGAASLRVVGYEADPGDVARWDGFANPLDMGEWYADHYGLRPGGPGREFLAIAWSQEVQL
ncbi:MAG: hypothetical protein ACOX9C_06505 [Kiritimatiellia bacterium]|jgi:hypothetical protein